MTNTIIMNSSEPVSTIMTQNVISVFPKDSFEKIQQLFQHNNFHHIPVISKGGAVLGIISKENWRASLKNISQETSGQVWTEKYSKALTAENVMTENPMVLDPDDSIALAADIFLANLFHALPIVEDNELQGLVTTYDLIKYAYQ